MSGQPFLLYIRSFVVDGIEPQRYLDTEFNPLISTCLLLECRH
jgi:hypothetical protein